MMYNFSFSSNGTKTAVAGWIFVLLLTATAFGQAKRPVKQPAKAPVSKTAPVKAVLPPDAPTVTLVDDLAFRKILVPNGKPLMINFWATWCGPCREEFPDLVKLDGEFKGKIDFFTVSLDEQEELTAGVPKFLFDMKAKMPTYLLVTPDEEAAIAAVSKEWAGALPLTVIYDPKGSIAYFRQGKVKPADVRVELNKLLTADGPAVTALP